MRVLVVYESMYGNTHAVATDIAAGLQAAHEVTLVPVTRATRDLAGSAELIVAGGPTHIHGMTTAASRRAAAEGAAKPDSGLTMDPDAGGPGLSAWLADIDGTGMLAASFDTRLSGPAAFTGSAGRRIARMLRRRGCHLLLAPESFFVSKQNTLLDGEAARARAWGEQIGEAARQLTAVGTAGKE